MTLGLSEVGSAPAAAVAAALVASAAALVASAAALEVPPPSSFSGLSIDQEVPGKEYL